MTVTELLAEILYRCGEGYENWTERAKEAFHAAVVDYIKDTPYDAYDYHGLIIEGTYSVADGTTIAYISMETLFAANWELIRFLELKKIVGSVTTPVNVVSRVEKIAADHNTDLGAGVSLWHWANDGGAGNTLVFDVALTTNEAEGVISSMSYVAAIWDNTLLDTGGTIISDYFTNDFLNAAIDRAALRLTKELRA